VSDHTVAIYMKDTEARISVDAPGERAVSAPIADPKALIDAIAAACNLTVTVQQSGEEDVE
jgi:hypothetical protein